VIFFLLFVLMLVVVFALFACRAYLRDKRLREHLSRKVIFSREDDEGS